MTVHIAIKRDKRHFKYIKQTSLLFVIYSNELAVARISCTVLIINFLLNSSFQKKNIQLFQKISET